MSSYPARPIGISGLKSLRTATPNDPLWSTDGARYMPNCGVIDGTKTRDALNTGDLGTIRGGTVMGRVTSGGKWSNSIIGVSDVAYASGTSLSLTEATGDEIVRRIGTSGTFKITGPPTAAGTVRTLTVTFSAIAAAGSGHRVATITALTVNEVQTVTFAIASTGGNVGLMLWDPRTSQYVQVPAAAWSATDATYLSNIQAKLDLAFGAANIVVVSAKAATDTDSALVFTYSGTGVAGLPCTDAAGVAKLPIVNTLPTSSTSYGTERTTSGVDGRFVTASLIQPTDGSETPRCIQGDVWGLRVLDDDAASVDVEFPKMLVSGILDTAKVINYPADESLKTWVLAQLNTYAGPFTANTNLITA